MDNLTNKVNDSTFDNDTLRVEVMVSMSSSATASSDHNFRVSVSYDGADGYVDLPDEIVTAEVPTPPTSSVSSMYNTSIQRKSLLTDNRWNSMVETKYEHVDHTMPVKLKENDTIISL